MHKFITAVISIVFLGLLSTAVTAQILIVGNKREHTVSFIDLKSGQEFARTKTGKSPHEVAVSPDGKTAVVVSYRGQLFTGNKLHVFDVASGKKTGVISLGEHQAPHGLKWIPGTSKVIATTEASQSVVIVDVAKMNLIGSVKTDQQGSHMVALAPDNKRAFVANIGSGSFTAIDLEKLEKITDVKAGEGTEAISITPDGKQLWVGNNLSKSIMVFDINTFEKLNEIKTEGIPIRVEISPDGKFAAVSEPDLSRVSIYSVDTREPVAQIDLSKADANVPVTLLFSPDSPKLWVATTGSAKVVEVDTVDWSIVRSLAAGEGSDGLGYSPIAPSYETLKKDE
jgi:DNA-binding beta-propeller fold protein YncE